MPCPDPPFLFPNMMFNGLMGHLNVDRCVDWYSANAEILIPFGSKILMSQKQCFIILQQLGEHRVLVLVVISENACMMLMSLCCLGWVLVPMGAISI